MLMPMKQLVLRGIVDVHPTPEQDRDAGADEDDAGDLRPAERLAVKEVAEDDDERVADGDRRKAIETGIVCRAAM